MFLLVQSHKFRRRTRRKKKKKKIKYNRVGVHIKEKPNGRYNSIDHKNTLRCLYKRNNIYRCSSFTELNSERDCIKRRKTKDYSQKDWVLKSQSRLTRKEIVLNFLTPLGVFLTDTITKSFKRFSTLTRRKCRRTSHTDIPRRTSVKCKDETEPEVDINVPLKF